MLLSQKQQLVWLRQLPALKHGAKFNVQLSDFCYNDDAYYVVGEQLPRQQQQQK